MDERNNETTPETNFEDPNVVHSSEGTDIYGDAEAVEVSDIELPVAEPESVPNQESNYAPDENLTEVGSEHVSEAEVEDHVDEAAESGEAEPATPVEVPHRQNEDAANAEETAADVVPEVESTVVTRRSLLGGARSSIPNSHLGEVASADATASAQPVAAEPGNDGGSAQPVVRRSIGLTQSAAASQDSFASELAAASAAEPSLGTNETRVQPAIPAREAVRDNNWGAGIGVAEGLSETQPTLVAIPSRFAAHAWGFLLFLVILPLSWYFITDGITHIALSGIDPWKSGTLSWVGLTELFGGAILAGILLFSARWSTVGVFFSSLLLTIIGIPFVVAPAWTYGVVNPVADALSGWNTFGKAVAHHFLWSGFNGLFVVAGIMGLAVWLAAHGARRKGIRRGILEATLEQQIHGGGQGNIFGSL